MPTIEHESLVELFRQRPRLAAELIEILGHELPAFSTVGAASIDFSQVQPAEYRSDHVVVLEEQDEPVLGIVIEIQRTDDPDKLYSWPVYGTDLRRRLKCPTCVLVWATTDAIARRRSPRGNSSQPSATSSNSSSSGWPPRTHRGVTPGFRARCVTSA